MAEKKNENNVVHVLVF